ncbi:hypothetical protein HMI55_001231 [Coelomomyces lativittatus]|nr:hypothetical protein HMI55_001231 [Coelomomyces lativittatus]
MCPHLKKSVEVQGEIEEEKCENVTRNLDLGTETTVKEVENKIEMEIKTQLKMQMEMEMEIQTKQGTVMEINMNLTPTSCENKKENLPIDSCVILECPVVEEVTSTISSLLPTKSIPKKGNKKQGCFVAFMFKFLHFTKPKFLKRRK